MAEERAFYCPPLESLHPSLFSRFCEFVSNFYTQTSKSRFWKLLLSFFFAILTVKSRYMYLRYDNEYKFHYKDRCSHVSACVTTYSTVLRNLPCSVYGAHRMLCVGRGMTYLKMCTDPMTLVAIPRREQVPKLQQIHGLKTYISPSQIRKIKCMGKYPLLNRYSISGGGGGRT